VASALRPGSKTKADTALAKHLWMRYMFPEIWKDFGVIGGHDFNNAHDRK
jgi:hypothetical protein